MHSHENKPNFKKTLKKLYKKDKKTYERVMNKIQEIVNSENIEHYKNLKYPLQHLKRIQIGEKVLVFNFDKSKNLIVFENFKHHDKIYLKTP